MNPKISFFCSAIRPHLWPALIDSLKENKYPYELVFAGFLDSEITNKFPEIKYIKTDNIKISQCYEIARRACTGDLVCWIEDDYVFSEGFVDKVYDHWMSILSDKEAHQAIITPLYTETGSPETIDEYRFYARNLNTPQMPLVGIMSRLYLQELGGIDSRYIKGRWNCDIAMRVLADGGHVRTCKETHFTLDSKNKHGMFNNFWSGWNEDSEQLENSWVIGGYKRFADPILAMKKDKEPYFFIPISNQEVTFKRNDKFSPFKNEDIMIASQSPVGRWFTKWG